MARRTTLTLEDEVMDRLLEKVRRTKRPFKEVVNDALRVGLDRKQPTLEPYRVDAHDMGAPLDGISLDSTSQLLELVEGPEHR